MYKQKNPRTFNRQGSKERMRTVLTLMGNGDTIEPLKPKKKTPEGYQ